MLVQSKIKHKDMMEGKNWFGLLRAKMDREQELLTSVENITPGRALAILEKNTDNRRLQPHLVDQYADDMKNGRWEDNGEVIIIAVDGSLNTGQHRLNAIIKAGVAIDLNVVRGAKRETRYSVDTGKVQSSGDKAKMKGYKYGNESAAIASAVIAFEKSGHINGTRISKAEILHRLDTDELIHQAAEFAGSAKHGFIPLKVPKKMVGFFWYTLNKAAPAKHAEFMASLRSGASLDADNPIYAVRNRLMSATQPLRDPQKIEAVFRAWNAWINGDTLNRIAIRGSIPELETEHGAA